LVAVVDTSVVVAATAADHNPLVGTVAVVRAARVAVAAIADWMDSWYSAVVVVAVDRVDYRDTAVAVAVAIVRCQVVDLT